MERSDSVAALDRLADAFAALVPDEPGLMVDRETRPPANAVGWPSGRNFRVRLRHFPAAGQASAYYRVVPGRLELMLATSRAGEAGSSTEPMSEDGVPDGVWGSVRVVPGDESRAARLVVERLRRGVQ
jgi:hypothetical protein